MELYLKALQKQIQFGKCDEREWHKLRRRLEKGLFLQQWNTTAFLCSVEKEEAM